MDQTQLRNAICWEGLTNTFGYLKRYVEVALVVGHHQQIANQLVLGVDGSLLVANGASWLHQLQDDMQ